MSSDPFAKVGHVQVATEVSSVIRASAESFRVAWTERRYENGALATTERWTAILTIVIDPPRDAERLRNDGATARAWTTVVNSIFEFMTPLEKWWDGSGAHKRL